MPSRKKYIEIIIGNMTAIKRTMMARGFAGATRSKAHITPSQWMALTVVMRRESTTVRDIAKDLGISSSAATQLIDELVNKGYLTREGSARDRRTFFLTLSAKYKKRVGDMRANHMQRFSAMFDVLTDKELAQYAALNKKVAESTRDFKK